MTTDATSTQALAEQTNQTDASVPEGPPGGQGGVLMDLLGVLGAGFSALTELEQQLTAPLGAIPFPALPALRVLDAEIGLPHGHYHPPNLIPPIIPVPLPLPSVGLILPIPFFSGAESVFVNGVQAARCGDMGVAVWCGSFFPMFEVFLGSANVWVEGSRAGRIGVDITTHCIFAAPKPQDPPCYPWIGFPITASGDVLVGGIPLPSLTNFAIGKAFEALFSGAMAIVRRLVRELRARAAVNAFMRNVNFTSGVPTGAGSHFASSSADEAMAAFSKNVTIKGDDAFQAGVRRDLLTIARTDTGRALLDRLSKQLDAIGDNVDIQFGDNLPDWKCSPHGGNGPDPFSPRGQVPMTRATDDPSMATHMYYDIPVKIDLSATGTPVGSTVQYNPFKGVDESPSDVILFHELVHAANKAEGRALSGVMPLDPNAPKNAPAADVPWATQWHTLEEFNTVAAENVYRADRGIKHKRTAYNNLPGIS